MNLAALKQLYESRTMLALHLPHIAVLAFTIFHYNYATLLVAEAI